MLKSTGSGRSSLATGKIVASDDPNGAGGNAGAITPAAPPSDLRAPYPGQIDLNLRASLRKYAGTTVTIRRQSLDDRPVATGVDFQEVGDLAQARSLVVEKLAPLALEACELLVVELRARTKQRELDKEIRRLQRKAFGRVLHEYPADVARYAVESLCASEEFMPSEARLRKECEPLAHERRLLLNEIDRLLPKAPRSEELDTLIETVAELSSKAHYWLAEAEMDGVVLKLKTGLHVDRFLEELRMAAGKGSMVNATAWLRERGVDAVEARS